MLNINLLIEQLKSWGNSYIPPSAKITINDAARMLIALDEEVRELRASVEKLEAKSNEPQPVIAAPTVKTAPKKRTKKAV